MEHQSLVGISASASGPHCSTGIKEEPEDDASQTVEKHSTDEYDKKELDIHIAYTTTLSVSDFNEKDILKEKLQLNSGGELFGLEVKNENSFDVSDCKQDSNLTRDHLPATTNIVQDSNLTKDHLPATTNIVQDFNLTRDHLPATTNIVQDSNLTRDHLPATTNIVQDDDELNQLTEVAGEMDCKDGIRNGNSNHLLVGRVIPTDVEGKDQEQLARDMECSDDIEGMSLLYCLLIYCKI